MVQLNKVWVILIAAILVLTFLKPQNISTGICDKTGCISAQDTSILSCYHSTPYDSLRVETDPFYKATVAGQMVDKCGILSGKTAAVTKDCVFINLIKDGNINSCAQKTPGGTLMTIGMGPLN